MSPPPPLSASLQFAVTYIRVELARHPPLVDLLRRSLSLLGVAALAVVWFGGVAVALGFTVMFLGHPLRFYPYPVLSAEDVLYMWIIGLALLQLLYRTIMFGLLGIEFPMRRRFQHVWVRVCTRVGSRRR